MKYLLILTFVHGGFHDVSRFEYPGILACTEAGISQSNFWLSHVPGIDRVTWECVKKEYGKRK